PVGFVPCPSTPVVPFAVGSPVSVTYPLNIPVFVPVSTKRYGMLLPLVDTVILSSVVTPISSIRLGSELKSGAYIVMYTRSVQPNIFLLSCIGDVENAFWGIMIRHMIIIETMIIFSNCYLVL